MNDISVNISNYVTSDRYKINIYRTASTVPVATLDVDINAGPIHIIRELPGGYTYDAEVLHYCAADPLNPSKYRKPTVPLGTLPCDCPNNYLRVDKICFRKTDTAPIDDGSIAATMYTINPNGAYNVNGIRVYNVGYSGSFDDSIAYESYNTVNYWRSNNLTTEGRMNLAGIRAALGANVKNLIVTSKITISGAPRVIYIAVSCTYNFKITHNGSTILTLTESDFSSTLRAYPVFVYPGENVFDFTIMNATGNVAMVAEIYNCSLSAIQNVDTGGEGTLNRLFTTSGLALSVFEFYSNLSCFPGYTLVEETGILSCRKIEYANCL